MAAGTHTAQGRNAQTPGSLRQSLSTEPAARIHRGRAARSAGSSSRGYRRDPRMNTVSCHPFRHSDAILAIFNEAIVNSTALYDYQPRTRENMASWWEAKARG